MRNNAIPSIFMHVDITQPLWAFWDIYGNTSRIRILGSCQQSLMRTSLPRQQSNQQLVQVESPTTNGEFVVHTKSHQVLCMNKLAVKLHIKKILKVTLHKSGYLYPFSPNYCRLARIQRKQLQGKRISDSLILDSRLYDIQ